MYSGIYGIIELLRKLKLELYFTYILFNFIALAETTPFGIPSSLISTVQIQIITTSF